MSDDKNVSATLAAATCALLGAGAVAPVMAAEPGDWTFDTALLYYGEDQGRVQDVSATIGAQRTFDDERLLNLTLTVDTLTGASASGATASDGPQTFTSPSGEETYTTRAGRVPFDTSFLDTRVALSGSWTQPFARLYTVSAGLGFSTEYDYRHIGANVSLARDFNKRNTTLSLGLAYSMDDVDPVGGAPIPFSQMLDVGDLSNKRGSDSKDIIDVLFGLTQVLSRTAVLRVNYSYSRSNGYLNDPYKILSLVDGVTGDTIPRTPPPGVAGATGVYLYENRPDSRVKHSLYAEMKQAFGAQVLYGSYRFMTDDWGIDSHTGEVRYRWPLGSANYIEPVARYYMQSQADFYRPSLVQGAALPDYASADFRLGKFDATTFGVKFGHHLSSGNEWNVRLEYYQQSGSIERSQLIGNQFNREQNPDLKAVIAQVGYRFGW